MKHPDPGILQKVMANCFVSFNDELHRDFFLNTTRREEYNSKKCFVCRRKEFSCHFWKIQTARTVCRSQFEGR